MKKQSVWEKNFAENRDIADRVMGYFGSRLKQIRADRVQMEEDLMRFYNMWNVTKDGYHSYNGRAQLYIPEVRKDVEEQARQMTAAAFPTDDFFDVSPGLTGTRRGSEAWKSIINWNVDRSALFLKYFVAMRQCAMLGTSPIYIPYNKLDRNEFRNMKVGKKVVLKKQKVNLFSGPDFIVRDLFKFYVFNPNKPDLEDGCFEDMVLGRVDLQKKEKAGLLANREAIEGSSQNAYMTEELYRQVQRMESLGILIQSNQGYAGEASLVSENDLRERDSSFLCTTIFCDVVLPEACEDDEDPELPIPLKIEIYNNNTVGLIQRNPFAHQRAPYVVGKYILPNADQFYGQGIPWAIQYMQYELNSKSEQCMDSVTLALNPLAIVDPGLAGTNNEFNVEPGAVWWANPQGVKFAEMPDVSAAGYNAMGQISQRMQEYSDRAPALPPQLLGKSRTATQSNDVMQALSISQTQFQKQNELMILQPMCEQWESLIQQNMDDEQIVMILGRRATDLKRAMVSKEHLLGKYIYFWKGASTVQNRTMLSSQMLNALKVISTLPPEQLQGINFQAGEFIKFMWKDIWQLPDADRILGLPEEMATQDAMVENKLVMSGMEIEVLPGDSDQEHMPIHDKGITEAKTKEQKTALMLHIMEHKKQYERKQQAAQAMQQQQMMMAQMQAQQAGQGQQGKRSPRSGNRTQLPGMQSAGDAGSGIR